MPELDASLTRPKLDKTLVIEGNVDDDIDKAREHPERAIFALVSVNAATAPTFEVPWSQLLALSLAPDAETQVLTVGRHKDCNVQLADPRVSVRHFEIVARRAGNKSDAGVAIDHPDSEGVEYECLLNDLSLNGTLVNGQVVGKGKSETIRSGDEICVLAPRHVGTENMIAFVFRNATEMLGNQTEARTLDLDDLVLCPICMQAIYRCVALMPCFHNFCMACYSEWMSRKDDCPVCRRPVAAIMKNHPMEAVVDAYLQAHPERRRSTEELEGMDIRDRLRLKAGGKVVRDTCTVGTSTATASPPGRGQTDLRRPSPTTRPGSQVCSLQ
mmetsp:Transcript_41018/g.89631  ORF Transcript_41018/g.89631 Transcript_41018/m.89631 type:complete len:328 (-) Transcript_41018:140-1123(-)